MELVVLDLETFWSTTHSLTKMLPIAYCMHPETEIISLAAKFGNKPTQVIFGEVNIKSVCSRIDWSDKLVVGHNLSGFDSMILAWRLGIKPKMWGCTLAMAAPIHTKTPGLSLAKLVEHYGLGVKDQSALVNTKGRHLAEFTEQEKYALGEYNKADVDQCYGLFAKLVKQTDRDEMRLIDMTIRMLVEPKFEVDTELLKTTLVAEQERKQAMLLSIAEQMGVQHAIMDAEEVADEVAKTLGSAAKFSALLQSRGVDVPTKISAKTGKEAPALAKTDEMFIALQSHDDPLIASAAQARLGVKSTLLETRIQAFLDAAEAQHGKLPVPLKYSGADTTRRWSGWGYNPQNLPRVSGKSSDALRNSLRAPKGYKVVVADLSGIELRVNHFLWKVPSSMAMFNADPEKADLYKHFAASMYNKTEAEVSKAERQVGKVCVAEGTLVYCKHVNRTFWCPIEECKPEYQLWDGVEWVWAKGVASNGWKKTQQLCGVSLTPDHLVLCGTTWQEARYVRGEKVVQALATGAENLPLRGMLRVLKAASLRSSLSAIAGFLSTRSKLTTSKILRQRVATPAPRKQRGESGTGPTSTPCLKTTTGQGYLTGYLRLLHDATTQTMGLFRTMAGGVFTYARNGAVTALRSFGTQGLCRDGTPLNSRWTGSTLTAVTTTATLDSSAVEKTCSTSAEYKTSKNESESLKRVYDILNCGPRNRFTVLSDRGPLVVHNCHLGLGFGAGALTFQKVAKLMAGIDLNEGECINIVGKWREEYSQITAAWKQCHQALPVISQLQDGEEGLAIDPWGMCVPVSGGIRTPKGLIRYPGLRVESAEGKREWWYGEGRHKARIYAGKITENLVQALARDVIAGNCIDIKKQTGYSPALLVHDEWVGIVPEAEAEHVLAEVQRIMRTPPVWWPELVTWSEGDIADTYGAAK